MPELNDLVASEPRSARYLLDRCRSRDALRCPLCDNSRVYVIERGKRRRCARCGHSFPPLAGRWLNKVKISPAQWLWMAKLYALEMPATTIAAEIGISYPTILKALGTIRSSIAQAAANDAAREAGPAPETPVFGIRREDDTNAPLEALPDDAVLLKIDLRPIRLVFTRRDVEFSALSWSGRTLYTVDLGKQYPRAKVYCSERGFWPFAKERLARHHGVSFDGLPLYLTEIHFRWTNRHGDLSDAVIERLCDFRRGPAFEEPPRHPA